MTAAHLDRYDQPEPQHQLSLAEPEPIDLEGQTMHADVVSSAERCLRETTFLLKLAVSQLPGRVLIVSPNARAQTLPNLKVTTLEGGVEQYALPEAGS